MSVFLFTTLLNHTAFTNPIRDCLTLPDVLATIPPLPDPPSRCPDQLGAWHIWLDLCKSTLRNLRNAHRRLIHRYRPTIKTRRSLLRMLHVSKKAAHRKIFQGDPLTNDSWTDPTPTSTSTITALTDPTTGRTYTDPIGMTSLTQTTFTRLWAPDPTVNPSQPYPFLHTSSDTFSLAKSPSHSFSNTLLPYVLRQYTFNSVIRKLKHNKTPGPDGIPNELLKLMPPSFMTSLRRLFIIFWLTGTTPSAWKHSLTILLHKKDDPTLLSSKRPIGLINSITKLWTRFITEVLSAYAEDNHILSQCQEGFRLHHNTSRHLQRLVHTLEDARSSHRNIYGLYIDLTSAFNTISHSHLFRIMHDLGFPTDAIDSVRDLYTDNHTRIILNRTTNLQTAPIPIGRGTIQGDTLSPLLFLIFMEPLLRWLSIGGHGYTPTCLTSNPSLPHTHPCHGTQTSPTFADDLLLLSPCHLRLQAQFEKVLRYCQWGGLSINPSKCAVTGALHHTSATGSSLSLDHHISLLRNQLSHKFITLDGLHSIPFLPPTSAYKYLGIHITFNLDFRQHLSDLIQTTKTMASRLILSHVPPRAALSILQSVLRPKLTYSFCITPFSLTDIHTLDHLLTTITRILMGLAGRSGSSVAFPSQIIRCSTLHGGVGLTSLLQDYIAISAQTLTRALNDTTSDLGVLTMSMLQHQLLAYGNLPVPLLPRRRHFHALPLSIRQLSLMNMADISLHCSPTGPLKLLGNDMLHTLTHLLQPTTPPLHATTPTPYELSTLLHPLFLLGLVSLSPLVEHRSNGTFLKPTSCLNCYGTSRQRSDIQAAQTALNQLTLILTGTPFQTARLHTDSTPLPDPPPPFRPGNQFRISISHDILQLRLPSPQTPPPSLKRSLTPHFLRDPDITHALHTLTHLTPSSTPSASDRSSRQRLANLPIPFDPTYRTPHTRSTTWLTQHRNASPLPESSHPKSTPSHPLTRPLKRRHTPPLTPPTHVFPYCHSQPPLDLHLTDLQRQGFWSHTPTFSQTPRATPTTHSLLDSHVTISTTPVHPDLDIQPTGSYCIQIGLNYPNTQSTSLSPFPHGYDFAHSHTTDWHRTSAFFYNPSGIFIACLPVARLHWLHDVYLLSRTASQSAFFLHSSGNFLHDLASLFHRYPIPKSTARPLYPNEFWSPPSCFPAHSTAYPITHHRFATPLTAPMTTPATTYFSFHPEDTLFGAIHNPFSEPWTGTSLVLPPYKPELLDRVVRHAIASVSSTHTPTTIILLLPYAPGSLYISRLQTTSPSITTLIQPLPPKTFSFPPPSHHTHRSHASPSPPLYLIHLSNTAGNIHLAHYLQYTPPPPPLSPHPHSLPSPFSDPLTQAILLYPPLSPLRWATQRAYYTDGSHKPNPDRTGASFYPTHQNLPTQDRVYTVNPVGMLSTNSITRAEMCGAASALEHDATLVPTLLSSQHLTIFLDSLVSLYLIQSALHAPHTLQEKSHAPLQLHIASLLLTRATLGHTTHLQKVTSHSACVGNDRADVGAATALLSPTTCDYNMSHINNQHLASLPAWPCLPPLLPTASIHTHPPRFVANLTSSLNHHIDLHYPDITAGGPPDPTAHTYPRLRSLQSITLPLYNNCMWSSSACTWPHIKTILQIRSKTLYTACSHTSRPSLWILLCLHMPCLPALLHLTCPS